MCCEKSWQYNHNHKNENNAQNHQTEINNSSGSESEFFGTS